MSAITVYAAASPDDGGLNPKDVMGLARTFLATHGWVIHLHDGQWWLWDGVRYIPIDPARLAGELWKWVEGLGAFTPTCAIVRNMLTALSAICRTPVGTAMPCWLGPGIRPSPDDIIPFRNGLLDVGGDEFRLLPHTPAWFSANCIPHPYDPGAECPEWDRFLLEVFEGDRERVRALQQWFGYNLTCDSRQHKFALVVGPPGSGKSTMLRALGEMLGAENVATPTLTTLWRFYGMETIYTKMAALVGDAHLETSSKATAILEKLKSVVGADRQNVDRKGKSELANLVVRVRFTIAVNEAPQFPDVAAALARRMLVIPFHRSFVGREDRGLGDRLAAEMPGIVAWAMRGLVDLRASGAFLQPEAGRLVLDDLAHLGSPVKEFLEDTCELDPSYLVPCRTLWDVWCEWCRANGHGPTNSCKFGAMLRAAHPGIKRVRSGRDAAGRQRRFYQGVHLRPSKPEGK